jgi:putative transposase
MVGFIDDHRDVYGVESICTVLPIAPSTYFRHKGQQADPTRRSKRARRDDELRVAIQRVWDENHQVYGPRKLWRQLRREGVDVARCRVRRLMKAMGLVGAVRGRAWITTTQPDLAATRPPDLVDRQFTATGPNQLWVSDFTYVATWRGFVYTAFVIDVFARRIVGWRVSSSLRTDFVLDALEQAICDRCGLAPVALIHHSDRGTQYVSMRYTDRLADAGIAPSVGSRGDSYDNALAESVIGLYKTEVIQRLGPWRSVEAVEFATLEWVDWFNMRRLLEPIGYVPPAEYEARYFTQQAEIVESRAVDPKSEPPGGAQSDDRRLSQGLTSPLIDQGRGGEYEASSSVVAASPAAPVRPQDQNRSSIAAGVM